ncbi:hypothetical protein H0A36_18775 [Endozoicomonas sp. SM1973]|uniref:Uncharacterized protein n=2 Tax=Spartinivicinus TaxID=2768738 RepID=A0A853I3X6_9GAMM|nr:MULTISPECIES: hypothetical protein [Spartinivicinus]MCX4029732.1 hypothetical protein [Spartinivicinus marinus]MDE1460887.1 hypothetical protein [Spartinivicinus sp. A2-2]NYZ68063.1 hypothetical protein [Spartinivicinus marinus]
MPSYLEIVELPDGNIALQRSDADEKPLVTISFSEEAKAFLQDNYIEVAKAMLSAGIHMVGIMAETTTEEDESNRVIH